MAKGILKISVDGEDEDEILESLWEIIHSINEDPDLLNDYVQIIYPEEEEDYESEDDDDSEEEPEDDYGSEEDSGNGYHPEDEY